MDQATVRCFFPTDGATTTATDPAAALSTAVATETPTMAMQIDSTSLETVIQSAVQASVSAMSEAIRPILSHSQGWWSKLQVGEGHERTSEYMK